MSKAHCLAFLVTITSVLMILSSVEVDAQSTVDDSTSCESSTLDEAVDLIREGFKDVKRLLGSIQQEYPPTEASSSSHPLVSLSEYKGPFRHRTTTTRVAVRCR